MKAVSASKCRNSLTSRPEKSVEYMWQEFKTVPFPQESNIVYVVGIEESDKFFPIYVGESSRHIGRMGDFLSANLSAPTDFKVGKVVNLLREQGKNVVFKYKASSNRKQEEAKFIRRFQEEGYDLLNNVDNYDSEEKFLERIKEYVTDILKRIGTGGVASTNAAVGGVRRPRPT